jgi:UDP-N-acetylmuramate--alanine ligase
VIGVFQPHLFTRTRDFAPEFAAVLSTLDEVVLLPIYPAREQPISGVTSDWLMSKMTMANGMKTVAIVEKADLANHVLQRVTQVAEPVVVITMGAGDIDRCVEKVKEQLILNCI